MHIPRFPLPFRSVFLKFCFENPSWSSLLVNMLFSNIILGLVAVIATRVQGMTLLQVLQSYPQLSTLSSYVNSSSSARSLLENANNFTFLAPSNAAIASYLTQNPNVLTRDLLEATLQYSLLQGGYPTLSFTDTPQFVATGLNNATYANVTGGQRIELMSMGGGADMMSGNQTVSSSSTADIVCTGGIVHIVSTVPQIPLSPVAQITASSLSYFVSILNTGQYLVPPANDYVNAILDIPDVTYFIPNSPSALASLQSIVKNQTAEDLKESFEYHVVKDFVGYSNLLVDGLKLMTVQGTVVEVSRWEDGSLWVNGARVVERDLLVGNGVVHVIDNLLNPNSTTPPTNPNSTTSTSQAPTNPLATEQPKNLPITSSSSTSSNNLTTPQTIGLAVGVAVFIALCIALVTFFLVRRSRQQRHSQIRTIISRNSSRRSNRSGSSIHSLGSGSLGSGKRFVVERKMVGMSDVKGSWKISPIRSAALEHARGGSINSTGSGKEGYRGVAGQGRGASLGSLNGGKNVDEFKAGPPYIPPRSPERTFGSLRREFCDL